MNTQHMAFDRASVRMEDGDGRLHIALSNISKATVNPYRGNEIPNWEELGLEPDRVYQLLRCPAELEKAKATFDNLPVLSKHVPVTAEAPMQELVIGSTGTDAAFVAPYLQNSAVIWVGDAIENIKSEKTREWSCAYHYVADMTPGTYQGLRYDGIMRNLRGNHLALVEEGRAGSDVVVGDSKLGVMMLKTRKALIVRGAVAAYLAPKLAMDQKIDLNSILANVTAVNFKTEKPKIAAALKAACVGKLAQDATLDDVLPHLDTLDAISDGEPNQDVIPPVTAPPAVDPADAPPAVDADGDLGAKIMAFLKGKVSDEDLAQVATMCGAGAMDADADADPDDKDAKDKDAKDKPAMDAAIRAAAKTARTGAIADMNAIRNAEREVRPVIGEVTLAMDSASAIYKLALDHLKVDLTGVPTVAYGALFRSAAASASAKPIAMDAAQTGDAAARFRAANPNAVHLIGA